MKLVKVDNSNKKYFIKFFEDRYLNNPLKRNSMSSLVKGLIYGKSIMCKSIDLDPLMIEEGGRVIMITILAFAHRMPDFIQIGFFEAIEDNPSAFQLILHRAREMAKGKGATKLSGSLNIHVNYGLGFLASDYDSNQGFGTPHNPKFYNTLFEGAGFETIDMVSFNRNMLDMKPIIKDRMRDRLKDRYIVRQVNFKELEKEAEIYTRINNEAFKNHPFYYPRVVEEDLELFKEFKYLLRPENLLFVEREGVPVGFMLWYPDFHSLMKPNETLGLKTVIKAKLDHNKMRTFKIVEIGVIPQEQNKGAIISLFDYCYICAKDKYDTFESGWVLINNQNSLALGERWADGIHKKYKAFIKDIGDESI
ncbi:hypothetical protein E9840_01805 [Tissierella creatinini]|nr:hypothetical protein E9840_01805 [Tissierella creatinini]TJX66503.1 hypothetical protein E8P77_07600 [Soehngenia saccharolytica]